MRTEPVGEVPGVEAALLTSGAAVARIAADGPVPGTPAWVVGPRTAQMARAAGFEVRGTAADVDALVGLVPPDAPPLTHLRGAHTRGDLAARLAARGLRVSEAVIYRQVALPLSEGAIALMRSGPVLVPLYSPRSARLFGAACPSGCRGALRLLALSRGGRAGGARSAASGSRRCPMARACWRSCGNIWLQSAVEGHRPTV